MSGKIDSAAAVEIGNAMHDFMRALFPICRSITGEGTRETLRRIKQKIPIELHEVASGTKVFDWVVPKEWRISDAFICDERGTKIVDMQENNLHVVGYSIPVDKRIKLAELDDHLYSLEELPDAVPYVTSYYAERWGFCISHNQRRGLQNETYHACIDSDLFDGSLSYGELLIPGKTDSEVLISTYVCHPSMANNELSGPVVTTYLAEWILTQSRKYSYRIVFLPETIGSITYLSRHWQEMRSRTIAGFNVTCIGDERAWSYVPTRYGDTVADRAALAILKSIDPDYCHYSYLDRGSDERQYCSPGIDLPVVSVMRSKYGEYPEYHTSFDNLDLVTPKGLGEGLEALRQCVTLIERNATYRVTCQCEPQLGRRGLYPTLGTRDSDEYVADLMNFLAYADGTNDLMKISEIIGCPVNRLYGIVDALISAGLIEEVV